MLKLTELLKKIHFFM